MGSMLSITIATEGAVRAVPTLYIRAARTMGARRLRLYTRVILPASLPGIVTGLKLGWTFAWRSLMAGELLYVAGGLGQLLTLGRELGDMARVMSVMVVIVVLGLGFERLLFGSSRSACASAGATRRPKRRSARTRSACGSGAA